MQRPDILIVEGLNVLQPARVRADGTTGLAVSDFFDFSVYVDADPSDVRSWYVSRFLSLRETAFRDPRSYFSRFAELSADEAVDPGRVPVGHDQRAESGDQHPADPRSRDDHPAQGSRSPGGVGPDPQGLRGCRTDQQKSASDVSGSPGDLSCPSSSLTRGRPDVAQPTDAMRGALAQRQDSRRWDAVQRWGLCRIPPTGGYVDSSGIRSPSVSGGLGEHRSERHGTDHFPE